MKSINSLSVLFFGFFIFTGCSKENDSDIRSNLVGTYSGTETVTINWSQLDSKYSDSIQTINGFRMKIDNYNNPEEISINEISGFSPHLNYIAIIKNSESEFVFKILSSLFVSTNNIIKRISIDGNQNYFMESINYDGEYILNKKQINFGYHGTITFASLKESIPYSVTINGLKE